MTDPGMTLKTGRRPPTGAPALKLAQLSAVLPPHPGTYSDGANMRHWLMLGNDQYGDCVIPETRVLTADLQWLPVGQLAVGDKLIAFDEEPRPSAGPKSKGRFYTYSTVECADRVVRPCYELEFSDGTVVTSSEGHRWLVGSMSNGARWVETKHLIAGSKNASSVGKPFRVWEHDTSWEAGYLAAAWNGEGNLDLDGSSMRLMFSQVANSMLDEVEHCLKTLDIKYTHNIDTRSQRHECRQDVHRVCVGKREEFLRALGMVRPSRLLQKLKVDSLGRMDRTNVARLVRKTFVGDREVVMLNTSSRTYFAEGLTSHNCVAVTWATQRRIASWNDNHDSYPTYEQVIQVYKTQNPDFPNQDDGMVIQDLLDHLHKVGGPDGVKVVAFAQVDHTNFEELKAATYLGQSLWLGVNVSMENEHQFNSGLPWTVTGPVLGGHSITATGYGSAGMGIETWGNMGSLSQSYCININNPSLPGVEEAWLVIWPEQVKFLTQAQRDAFQVAYGQVTGGKTIVWPADVPPAPDPVPVPPPPAPTPPPVPTPPPPPAPTPPPVDPVHAILAKLRELWHVIDAWLKSQGV